MAFITRNSPQVDRGRPGTESPYICRRWQGILLRRRCQNCWQHEMKGRAGSMLVPFARLLWRSTPPITESMNCNLGGPKGKFPLQSTSAHQECTPMCVPTLNNSGARAHFGAHRFDVDADGRRGECVFSALRSHPANTQVRLAGPGSRHHL